MVSFIPDVGQLSPEAFLTARIRVSLPPLLPDMPRRRGWFEGKVLADAAASIIGMSDWGGALEDAQAANAAALATLATAVATNTSAISANTSAISANTAAIASLLARIATVTPQLPGARPFGAAPASFQPHETKPVLCLYSFQMNCSASLAGGQQCLIELRSDAATTPTTVRSIIKNRNSVSLAIALTSVNEQSTLLAYLVPAGHYVRLVEIAPIAPVLAGTSTLVAQSELVLG